MEHSEKDSNDLNEKPNYIVEGNKYVCLFCGSKNLNKARCEAHVRDCDEKCGSVTFIEVDGYPKFQCTVCSRLFKYFVAMKKHELKHNLPGGFICSTCGQRHISEIALSKHHKTKHKNEIDATKPEIEDEAENQTKPFRCNDCGAIFLKQNAYQAHLNSKCGTDKKFKCKICSAKFLTKNTLYAHKQIHVGVKRHLCDYCGTSFLSKGQLKVHERSHTGEKPFKCETCNKGFSYRESLVTHSSVHTGIRPYACQACDLRFSCIGNLIKHRRARPETCGLAKYQNHKVAPRASTKLKQISDATYTVDQSQEIEQKLDIKRMSPVNEIIEVERITASPVLEPYSTIFESPPTIKTFSETTITDQKPILYRITEIKPIDSQIIDLNSIDEIRSFKDENIIVTMKADLDDQDDEGEMVDEQEENAETNEEYLQYVQSADENSGDGAGGEYVTSDWYEKSENIEYVKNDSELVETNYVLEIELQNTDQPEPTSDSIYTIIKETPDCETFILQTASEKDSQNEMLVKYENSDEETEESDQQEDTDITPIEPNTAAALYKCSFCPQLYLQENRLRNHLIIDHFKNDNEPRRQEELANDRANGITDDTSQVHRCPLCPKMYIQPIRLRNHLIIDHMANGEFACRVCYKWFDSEGMRTKHERSHGPDGSLIHKCPSCELYFGSLDELEAHHHQIHFCFRCPKCAISVDTMELLKLHITEKHKLGRNDPNKNKCELCGRLFSTKIALSDHVRANCGRSPLYKCESCGKSYHSAGNLKIHKTIHTGELPFQCKYCNKMFRTKGQVKVHERQHSGEKPFKCDSCIKTFAYRESLITHQSTHTGRKRFMCVSCGLRFSCISNLQSHRKTRKQTCGQLVSSNINPLELSNDEVKLDELVE